MFRTAILRTFNSLSSPPAGPILSLLRHSWNRSAFSTSIQFTQPNFKSSEFPVSCFSRFNTWSDVRGLPLRAQATIPFHSQAAVRSFSTTSFRVKSDLSTSAQKSSSFPFLQSEALFSLSVLSAIDATQVRSIFSFGAKNPSGDSKGVSDTPPSPPPGTSASPQGEATINAKASSEAQSKAQQAASNAQKELIQKLEDDLKDMKDKYMRSLAEKENQRMRLEKVATDAKMFAMQGFCKDVVEVADVLSAALGSLPPPVQERLAKMSSGVQGPEKSSEAGADLAPVLRDLFEGVRGTQGILMRVFSKHGLKPIEPAVGDKFDPNIHHASFLVPLTTAGVKGAKANTVSVVSKVGYTLHGRTIRPALVGVFQ